jgi:hypothetical protein
VKLGHPGGFGPDPAWVKRQAIADALRGVDLLRDPQGRMMCIGFSTEEIGEDILQADADNAEPPDDEASLLTLVNQLLSREVAMWVFVYTITDIYGASGIGELVRVVSSYVAEPVLTREQRWTLHQLCRDLSVPGVPRMFGMSIDLPGYRLRSSPDNLCAVLNELEEFQVRDTDGLHPIAVFVEYLASGLPPEAADRLQAWSESFVGTRTSHVTALQAIRNSLRVPRDPEPHYCTIYLEPDAADGSLYQVSIHLQEGSQSSQPWWPPDDVSRPEAEVRRLIGEALNSRQLTGVHPGEVRVEFFVPTFLINLPVEAWRVGAARIPLGVQYQVVIRSLTRLRDLGSAHAYLHTKWSRIAATEFAIPSRPTDTEFRELGEIDWLTEGAVERHHDAMFVSMIKDEGPVCLLLAQTPAPDRCPALALALAAGIPILLWSRRPEIDLGSGLRGLLDDAAPLGLSELPRRVLTFRGAGPSPPVPAEYLANHLTLLYDDGDRIPDAESLLQAPV